MANAPTPQLGARGTDDQRVISDYEFQQKHGLSRDEYAERGRLLDRERYEADAVADLDDTLDRFTGTAAVRYASYHGLLALEQGALAELERRAAELESIIAEPIETESGMRATVRRVADRLLAGKSADESDKAQVIEARDRAAAQQLRAEAAKLALGDIAKDIDRQGVRCRHVKSRGGEFLAPVVFEAVRHSAKIAKRESPLASGIPHWSRRAAGA
jgi:hypothetical protein